MASLGPGNYAVVVLLVGGSKVSNIKFILQREPRTCKIWFPAGSILWNEAPVDAAVRELFQETNLTLTVDELTILSDNPDRVPLPASQYQLARVFSAMAPLLYVNAYLRELAKVEQAVIPQLSAHHDRSYVVPTTVDIDGLAQIGRRLSVNFVITF
jgi:8-oxo-dGTP pyrophosphatase MutT (NUDIX family)